MRLQSTMLLLATMVCSAVGARVLAVLPLPARSHHMLFRGVLKALAARGHEVVSYTPIPMEKPIPNYTEILLENTNFMNTFLNLEQTTKMMTMSPVTSVPNLLWKESLQLVQETFKNAKFQNLLNSTEKFDLIVIEALLAQESLLGLGHKFNAPVVNIQPFNFFSISNKVSGNPLLLSYIPEFVFPYSDHMSFYEKLFSAFSKLRTLYLYYNEYLPNQVEFTKEAYKDPTMPSIIDMVHNITLYIDNAHPNVHYSQPYAPNVVSVGGIHLEKEHNPLPPVKHEEVLRRRQTWCYILFLGILGPDHLYPQEYFDNFINVFRRLPQRVLWKTGAEHKGLPENIMTAKWMPQQDVLAHPNIVLFMTHGGLFSQHEAINAGVPVVCTPYFGDQPMNAKFYEEKGIGVRLLFDTLSEDTIFTAISTVLNNPEYKENMQKMSRIYQDRPLSPADSLVFWVEYVLRHKGAQHLRPASAYMPWYQLALLDVLAAILLAVLATLGVSYLLFKKLISFKRVTGSLVSSSSCKKKD